jgi:hypothetical protein
LRHGASLRARRRRIANPPQVNNLPHKMDSYQARDLATGCYIYLCLEEAYPDIFITFGDRPAHFT